MKVNIMCFGNSEKLLKTSHSRKCAIRGAQSHFSSTFISQFFVRYFFYSTKSSLHIIDHLVLHQVIVITSKLFDMTLIMSPPVSLYIIKFYIHNSSYIWKGNSL